MSFGIRLNIAIAVMEEIYERLYWIYITVKNTLVYDHVGWLPSCSILFSLQDGSSRIQQL